MANAEFNIWELVAGLGIFLFGMHLMEESIRKLSGRKLKYLIGKFTSTNFKGVLTGIGATALLQSSSAVTLMILAFVGAGIMTLENAFAVIIGSNIGTTVTSWIVASIGFKVNIDALALPFIGIGGLMLIFLGAKEKTASISKMFVGFGFLFLGLNYMKTAMEILAAGLDLTAFQGSHAALFFLVGFIITAAIQSSSATMAIILTSVHAHIIEVDAAVAMVIGANVGTTITVIIGSIGGEMEKKRVALSHFMFNFVTGVVAFAALKPLTMLVFDVFGFASDPVIGIALFHTLFKVIGFVIFFPTIFLVIRFIKKAIPEKPALNLVELPDSLVEVPQAALEALKDETTIFIKKVIEFNSQVLEINNAAKKTPSANYNFNQAYELLKKRQGELFIFGVKLQAEKLSALESEILHNYLHAMKYAMASAKSLKDVHKDFIEIRESGEAVKKDINDYIVKAAADIYIYFTTLLDVNEPDRLVADLVNEKMKMIAIDTEITSKTADALKSIGMNRDELTYLLSVNRNFNQSNRQLIAAMRDLKLAKNESAIYERL
ncbi:MAG: Na/Pi cotransporter family protein [Cyclobacteriaceae bacterium]